MNRREGSVEMNSFVTKEAVITHSKQQSGVQSMKKYNTD